MSNYEDVYAPDLTEETESTLSGSEQFVMFDSVEGKRAELSTIADYIVANGEIDGSDIPTIVSTIEGSIGTLDTKVGDLTDLDTTDKTDIVSAVNEVNGKAEDADAKADTVDEHVGDLSELETEDKTSAVDAINEVLSKIPVMTKEVTGNPITVDDALNADVVSLGVELTPVQDLNGYDKPWAAGAGANKWDEQWELGGIVNTTGQPYSANDRIRSKNYCKCLPSTDYYGTTDFQIYFYEEDKTFISYTGTLPAGSTVTTPATAGYFKIVKQGVTTYSNNISVNYPSTVTTYSPYSNICPITGHDSVTVGVTGINQWDEEWELGGYNATTGQKVVGSSKIRNKNLIPVQPNTAYYFKSEGAYTPWIALYFYTKDGTYLSYLAPTVDNAFTTPNNAYYMAFNTSDAYGTTYNNDISINYPSTDTTYHAYHGHTKTVTLPHTVYGGNVDVTGGAGKEKMGIVDMADLNWYLNGDVPGGQQFAVSLTGKAVGETNFICSAFETHTPTTAIGCICGRVATTTVGCNALQLTVADFKAAVAGQTICYELATPTDLSTTPTDITLYNGDNVVSSDGDMDMVYVRDIVKVIEKLEG